MANPEDVKRALVPGQKDLKKLKGADLSGANLRDANLFFADLKGADLRKADLRGAYLYGAFLSEAKLTGANLKEADLREADLREADLSDAYLYGAKLIDAYLKNAKLGGATLTKADLTDADLRGANLEGADLRHAILKGANLEGADLADAKGIPLSISDKFPHKGETVEERLRVEREEKRVKEVIKKLSDRVKRTKPVNIRNLEALAKEVGSLQAQPQYLKDYSLFLKKLQETIEAKYAIHGKDHRYLQKQFKMARRASQVRTASQMNRELQREIKALKRDLNR